MRIVAGLVSRPTFLTTAGLVLFGHATRRPLPFAMASGSSSSFHGHKGASLEEGGVIPDVLDGFTPEVHIKVSYDGLHVAPGAQLLPTQAVHMPLVALEGSKSGSLYTLVMSDPDAPSPSNPTHREWLHWIVTNIPGGAKNIADGHQLVPYAPPTPPKGNHRYVFAAFEQPGGHTMASVKAPATRSKFHARAFAKELGLTLVGATYFKAAHQE